MIINATPIAAGAFNGYWITNTQFVFGAGKNGLLQANLLPYDGTHLLATASKQVSEFNLTKLAAANPAFNTVLTNLKTEVATLSGNADPFTILSVIARDPSKPVRISILWEATSPSTKATSYTIADAYALAAKDTVFADVFNATMAEIANLAGLTVQ